MMAGFFKKSWLPLFLETLTSWEKNPRRRQALPFPAGFPQRVFKDPHSFKN